MVVGRKESRSRWHLKEEIQEAEWWELLGWSC